MSVNDVCVLHRDATNQPDLLKMLPDCPTPRPTLTVLPGPYNMAPFLFWGGFVAFILTIVASVIIYKIRADNKEKVNSKMVTDGMPRVRDDIRALQAQLAKLTPFKFDERLKKVEQFFAGN